MELNECFEYGQNTYYKGKDRIVRFIVYHPSVVPGGETPDIFQVHTPCGWRDVSRRLTLECSIDSLAHVPMGFLQPWMSSQRWLRRRTLLA
jgi:hypothetical protein